MENNFFEKEKHQNKEQVPQPLIEAYRKVHGKFPDNLSSWQVAQRIVEVLDDPNSIDVDTARECVYLITNGGIKYPDESTRIDIVSYAEEQSRYLFPELAHIDEVHMADIERAYYKWKEKILD